MPNKLLEVTICGAGQSPFMDGGILRATSDMPHEYDWQTPEERTEWAIEEAKEIDRFLVHAISFRVYDQLCIILGRNAIKLLSEE